MTMTMTLYSLQKESSVTEEAEREVTLTLSSGLVAWSNGWSTSLEDAWHENVVPLLLHEWMSAKLIPMLDFNTQINHGPHALKAN
jgi:hypothetical protein